MSSNFIMKTYQNIVSLIAMLLLLPSLLVIGLVKIVSAIIIYLAGLLLSKQYDKSKEWKVIKMFNKLGELVLN